MYLDVYFGINLLLDGCALTFAVRKYGIPRRRLWLAAAMGALGACLWEISRLPEWIRPLWALALSGAMVYMCIGARPKDQWVRTLMELYGFSFLFAGIIPFVSRYVPLWIGSVLLAYTMIRLWLRWQEQKQPKSVPLQIEAQGVSWTMTALVDTGHLLREPLTKRPVIIVLAAALPKNIRASWPVCYETVRGGGVLYGFWPTRIQVGERVFKEKEVLVAAAPEWHSDGYEALIPGYMME